jgi:hypothetical protein
MCTPSFIAVLSGPSRRFPTRVRRRTVEGAQAYVTCPPADRRPPPGDRPPPAPHARGDARGHPRDNEIIVGANSDRAGGVCPMLAAHRSGGRTSEASFARAWDRFAGARRPRRATPEEVRVLGIELAAGLARDRVAAPSAEPARAPVAVR